MAKNESVQNECALLSALDTPITAWSLPDLRRQADERVAALFLKYDIHLESDASNWIEAVKRLVGALAKDHEPWILDAGSPCDCNYTWRLAMALARKNFKGLQASSEQVNPGVKGRFVGREFETINVVKTIQKRMNCTEEKACELLSKRGATNVEQFTEEERRKIETFIEAVQPIGESFPDRLKEAKARCKSGAAYQRQLGESVFSKITQVLAEVATNQDRKLAVCRLKRVSELHPGITLFAPGSQLKKSYFGPVTYEDIPVKQTDA